MSKQEEIIEVCGKKVVVRYTREGHPCDKCVLDWTKECDPAKCSQLNARAYFVEAAQPIQGSIASEADLEAEAERFLKTLPWRTNTPPIPDEYLDEKTYLAIARHFAEWERKRTLDKVVEWMKANLTYTHPRKGVETCMVNITAFLDAMNEENT